MGRKKVLIKDGKMNFKCLGGKCPRNCCGPSSNVLEGIMNGVERVFDIPAETVPLTDENYKKIRKSVDNEGLVKCIDAGWHIKQSRSKGCYFLKNNKCSIYKYRGSSCKSYPFFFDKWWGFCVDVSCPGVGSGWTPIKEILKSIEELIKLYEHQMKLTLRFLKGNNK